MSSLNASRALRAVSRVVNERGDNHRAGITWGQRVGNEECPYLRRWVFNYGFGSIRVHHWTGSDDPRHLHDHPWWFLTLVVAGGYTDVHRCSWCKESGRFHPWLALACPVCSGSGRQCEHLRAPAVRFRPALHSHTVCVDPEGCWTVMVTGRPLRDWGFYVGNEWKRMRWYFKQHGHHPCE